MSIQRVKEYFRLYQMEDRIIEMEDTTATVEQAASAIGCEPARIAKTMSFITGQSPVLIVTAGDSKVDNRKFREEFHDKARMIPAQEVESMVGYAPGGVCPFALPESVAVYLDQSLQRFDVVYPAAGNGNSAVRLTIPELEKYSHSVKWVDVCKGWLEAE